MTPRLITLGSEDFFMQLDEAIELLKKAVKFCGTIDQKHIDLTIVPAEQRHTYEKALAISQLSVKEGEITRDELLRRLTLD
jgi:hypothetical protein